MDNPDILNTFTQIASNIGTTGLLLAFAWYGIQRHAVLQNEYIQHLKEDIERLKSIIEKNTK